MSLERRRRFCGEVRVPESDVVVDPPRHDDIPRVTVVKTEYALTYRNVRTHSFPVCIADIKRPNLYIK